jgi:regulation of enolase protein 1 (concanavalin A-like superfamily)
MKSPVALPLCFAVAIAAVFAGHDAIAENNPVATGLAAWGQAIDPDGDCKFFVADGELLINVPGSTRPHDLAADVDSTNAPRVLQPAKSDFTLQVVVDGRFAPGDESTLPGRVGYNGAGLVAVLDSKNVVTLARAVIHSNGGQPKHYANFEIRINGNLQRIGYSSDCPLPESGPVHLRLERRGQKILGAASIDGNRWTDLGFKGIPDNWIDSDVKAGVVAISTSKKEFNPRFSKLQVLK